MKTESDTAMQEASRTIQRLKAACNTGKYNLLMIDDDAVFCRLWEIRLKICGKTFAEASSLEEAEAFIAANGIEQIEKIIIDYYLGADSGIEFREKCHELWPGVPVMMVSGANDVVSNFHENRPAVCFASKDDEDAIREFLGIADA